MATPPKPAQKSNVRDEREDVRDERHDVREARSRRAGEAAEGEPDQSPPEAPPVTTIADEQRARSDEIMAEGVEAWKAEHDERTEEEKAGNKQTTGVAPPAPEHASTEGGSWQGSTRTTPAARQAQNPAAPR